MLPYQILASTPRGKNHTKYIMEDYKANQLLKNKLNHLSKFKRKNCVETNDDKRRTCNTNNQIKLKATMIKQNMWKHCDAYISFTEIITVANSAAPAQIMQIKS